MAMSMFSIQSEVTRRPPSFSSPLLQHHLILVLVIVKVEEKKGGEVDVLSDPHLASYVSGSFNLQSPPISTTVKFFHSHIRSVPAVSSLPLPQIQKVFFSPGYPTLAKAFRVLGAKFSFRSRDSGSWAGLKRKGQP